MFKNNRTITKIARMLREYQYNFLVVSSSMKMYCTNLKIKISSFVNEFSVVLSESLYLETLQFV